MRPPRSDFLCCGIYPQDECAILLVDEIPLLPMHDTQWREALARVGCSSQLSSENKTRLTPSLLFLGAWLNW